MASTPWLEGVEAIMFRAVGDQPSLWQSWLLDEVPQLPEELPRDQQARRRFATAYGAAAGHARPVSGAREHGSICGGSPGLADQ
jgi:hypothetical protein